MRQIALVLVISALSLLLGCDGGGAPSDNQPPRIENLQIQPSDLIASGTQVTVTATVIDEGNGVDENKVSVEVTYPDGQKQVFAMSRQANNQFSATFKAAQWGYRELQSYESYVVTFSVIAFDKSGNKSSEERRVRAAVSPPLPPSDF